MSGLEGLAAVSLAGNILQFVTTAKNLMSTTREVLDSGAKTAHNELEIIAKDWRSRVELLSAPAERTNDSLEALAMQCKETADALLAILAKLRLDEDRDKFKSFLQALRSQWHESEIEALRQRLNTIGQAVCAHIANDQQLRLQARLDELLEANRRLDGVREAELEELKSFALSAQIQTQQKSVDEEKLSEQIDKIAADGKQYSAEQRILQCLRFLRIEDRYSSISPAHLQTLSWIYDSEVDQDNSATFVQWLSSDDDLYWISGRPGSGKSTLMKFLYTHDATKEHLTRWAGGDEVLIAEYFFWNAGKNELQKSQEGLLRSLIYQLLRKQPDSICHVFPDAWQHCTRIMSHIHGHEASTQALGIPSDTAGLTVALQRTCDALAQSKKRFCLFVDGLDEYSGNADQLVELVNVLRALKKVKICVSSRPWLEFERAYGKSHTTKLLMEDFNHRDISAYVSNIFDNDEDYQDLQDVEISGKAMVEEIVTAANGVFLWVVLVVRSLQEGLREGDGIDRLRNRLRDLPTDLSDLFGRILFNDVEPSHRERAARMFLVTLKAKENLPLMAYWYLDEPEVINERQPLKIQKTTYRHRMVKKKLMANGKGLLESRYRSSNEIKLPSAILFDYRVDFLHRTVREYLELPTTDLHTWVSSDFDTDKAICEVVFSQIKTAPHGKEYAPSIASLYSVFKHHIGEAANDMALQKLAIECESIVSEYGVTVSAQSEIDSIRDHEANLIPAKIELLPQMSGSTTDSSIVAVKEPASSKKQSSSARRILQKFMRRKDMVIDVAN
jgi:hypothetical protein